MDLKRQRKDDLHAFTGDIAVARKQIKTLEQSVRRFLSRATAEKENSGRIFDAKDVGQAKRLASLVAEIERTSNFIGEMKRSTSDMI